MKRRSLLRLLLLAPAFCAATAQAQLVDCNVFLQGNYVELGINWNGAFGSSTASPAGYHSHLDGASNIYNSSACGGLATPETTALGFVADPHMDGWGVGTPAFFGDYFVPGMPQEGWSIMADGTQANAWNQDAVSSDTFPAGLTGGNVSYTNTGGISTGIWQGSYDSIAISQVTTLDTSGLYFTMQITLTNLASTPREDVYYLRTVDPDNEEPETGSFTTLNTIEHQLPDPANLTVVSAAGTTYTDAYLALATTDLRAKAFYLDFGLAPSTFSLSDIYNGLSTYTTTVGSSSTNDVGIGLVFKIGHLASVDTVGATDSAGRTMAAATPPNRAVINVVYTFKQNSLPGVGTLGVHNVASANIKAYPNPAKDNLSVTGLTATDHVTLFDMMGKVVSSNWSVTHDGTSTFNMSDIPAGAYILQVSDKDGAAKSKIPVQKL